MQRPDATADVVDKLHRDLLKEMERFVTEFCHEAILSAVPSRDFLVPRFPSPQLVHPRRQRKFRCSCAADRRKDTSNNNNSLRCLSLPPRAMSRWGPLPQARRESVRLRAAACEFQFDATSQRIGIQ